MNKLLIGFMALGMLAAQLSSASAAVCGVGVYRAGCVSNHGAVVVGRPVVHPVVHPRCFWRAGVRVCR